MCKWKGVCVCGGAESCRVTDVEIAWSQKCSDTRIIVQETQTSDAEASMLRTETSMCVFTRKYCSLKVQFREERRIKQRTN